MQQVYVIENITDGFGSLVDLPRATMVVVAGNRRALKAWAQLQMNIILKANDIDLVYGYSEEEYLHGRCISFAFWIVREGFSDYQVRYMAQLRNVENLQTIKSARAKI